MTFFKRSAAERAICVWITYCCEPISLWNSRCTRSYPVEGTRGDAIDFREKLVMVPQKWQLTEQLPCFRVRGAFSAFCRADRLERVHECRHRPIDDRLDLNNSRISCRFGKSRVVLGVAFFESPVP